MKVKGNERKMEGNRSFQERRDSFQSFGEPSAPSVRSPPSPMEGLYKARMSMMPPMPPSIEGRRKRQIIYLNESSSFE